MPPCIPPQYFENSLEPMKIITTQKKEKTPTNRNGRLFANLKASYLRTPALEVAVAQAIMKFTIIR
jgi:hypothetical protein